MFSQQNLVITSYNYMYNTYVTLHNLIAMMGSGHISNNETVVTV